jgi:NAD(P)-dependent dehydrogenase (short-subunit alcohol dehydrogenase family)
MNPRILIIGANGQIGSDLGQALAARHGTDAVLLSDMPPRAAARLAPRAGPGPAAGGGGAGQPGAAQWGQRGGV